MLHYIKIIDLELKSTALIHPSSFSLFYISNHVQNSERQGRWTNRHRAIRADVSRIWAGWELVGFVWIFVGGWGFVAKVAHEKLKYLSGTLSVPILQFFYML
jgi:hypothetical protein